MRPMHMLHLIAPLALLAPLPLLAQSTASPIRHSLYVALGGDAGFSDGTQNPPLFLSAGVEREHAGSRWSLRLGADYRRMSSRYSETRWEDFGVSVNARYGRRSGTLRPYLLGGVGIADLRIHGPFVKYNDVIGPITPPLDSTITSASRWNGSIDSGVGTDLVLGRLRLFTEARVTLYPARLSDHPGTRGFAGRKALYLGIKL